MYLDQHYLLAPGPTPVPDVINRFMTQPMIGHRTEQFQNVFHDAGHGLKKIFGSSHPVVILSGSGTSALETAMVNTVDHGDTIVVVVSGAFGNRFRKIAEAYAFDVHVFEVEWGKAVDVENLYSFITDIKSPVKAVFTQLCETSTGVLHPVESMGKMIKEQLPESYFIVDGVSIVGAVDINMAQSHIDVLVAGSQKALMLPAGLAFIAYNERAKSRFESVKTHRFYTDLNQYIDSQNKDTTPFTPAIGLIQGISGLLELIEKEGFDKTAARHELIKDALRNALKALNMPLLVEDVYASPTVTAIVPKEEEINEIKNRLLDEFHITIAGGQGKLKGKILRIGHMGYVTPFDMLKVISALEIILTDIRSDNYIGKGLTAFQEVIYHGH